MARDLAYNDYNNRKAELHNQWLKESEIAWNTYRVKVAYPPIPQFPTEAEVIFRANKLIEFLNTPRPDLEPTKQPVVEKQSEPDSINLEYQEPSVATIPTKQSVMERLQDITLAWKK